MTRRFFDRQREKWALIQRRDPNNTKLAIFVHGWNGEYLGTWGDLARYLENHADQEEVLDAWDYLFVGYETYSIASLLDIARLIATKWHNAARGRPPFGHPYTKVALIGHSLGTLGIRQLLCAGSEHPPGMLRAIHCVLFFGSPINGSPLARIGGLARTKDLIKGRFGALLPNSYQINDALRPGGQILKMLHVWNDTRRLNAEHRNLEVKILLGADDLVVYQGGIVNWQGDSVRKQAALDHAELCKVSYNGDETEGFILDELRGELG